MLGKLFKHEMNATSRSFLLMYAVLIFMAVCSRIFIIADVNRNISNPLLQQIFSAIEGIVIFSYVILCIALFVVTFVFVIMRFYKNLTGDEGYLMHTLPVTSSELILSKLFAAVIWFVLSTIIFVLSLFILFSNYFSIGEFFRVFGEVWAEIPSNLTGQASLLIILYILIIIVGIFSSILMYYMCIAIGQLFNSHRVLGSIAAYFGINFVLQIISSIFTIQLFFHMADDKFIDFMNNLTDQQILGYVNGIMAIGILIGIVFCVVYFFITRYLLTKKLNLE